MIANRIDRTLTLGGVDEWTLQSHFVSHPFHIHVNPFQVVKIIEPDGKRRERARRDRQFRDDPDGKPIIDPEYPGLKGVWKDTLWIKNLRGGDRRGPSTRSSSAPATSATSATSSCTATSSTTRTRA